MKYLFLFFLINVPIFTSICASDSLYTKVIDYKADGLLMKGYLAYDKTIKGKRPGVLIIHEWWGHNEYVRKRARKLAQLGYVAFAADMYGGGRFTTHPETAGHFSRQVRHNMDGAKLRFEAALKILKKQRVTYKRHIAAIGYCFGGGMVLNMARMGIDIDGVISFHGGLATGTPAQAGSVKARILVFNGAADPIIPQQHVQQFEREMDDAGVEFELVNYPGVMHSFTNPDADKISEDYNLPVKYDAEADADSWQRMLEFFKQIFNDT